MRTDLCQNRHAFSNTASQPPITAAFLPFPSFSYSDSLELVPPVFIQDPSQLKWMYKDVTELVRESQYSLMFPHLEYYIQLWGQQHKNMELL